MSRRSTGSPPVSRNFSTPSRPTSSARRAVRAKGHNPARAYEGDSNVSAACNGYRDAAERFESAIYSLLGQPMDSDDDRDNLKAYAAHLQEYVDKAKAGAADVCGKS